MMWEDATIFYDNSTFLFFQKQTNFVCFSHVGQLCQNETRLEPTFLWIFVKRAPTLKKSRSVVKPVGGSISFSEQPASHCRILDPCFGNILLSRSKLTWSVLRKLLKARVKLLRSKGHWIRGPHSGVCVRQTLPLSIVQQVQQCVLDWESGIPGMRVSDRSSFGTLRVGSVTLGLTVISVVRGPLRVTDWSRLDRGSLTLCARLLWCLLMAAPRQLVLLCIIICASPRRQTTHFWKNVPAVLGFLRNVAHLSLLRPIWTLALTWDGLGLSSSVCGHVASSLGTVEIPL